VFASRERLGSSPVEIAFTDRHGGVSADPFDSLDLSRSRPGRDDELAENQRLLAEAFAVPGFATMRQVHGTEVRVVDAPGPVSGSCDALVTTAFDVALCVRVGDCVPVLLADATAGVVGVAHAGRSGVAAGIVGTTLATMRRLGAVDVEAYVGPHVCGGCYEVPATLRDRVANLVPAAFACTTWGTPSLDLGAAVNAQLEAAGCVAHDRSRCTRESDDLFSYRRDGDRSGRFAGLVVIRGGERA